MTITIEQLELAAKAAGVDLVRMSTLLREDWIDIWNPLTDHGQLHDLAMACGICIDPLANQIRYYLPEWRLITKTVDCQDFPSLAEAVITAAAEQQLAKEKKE